MSRTARVLCLAAVALAAMAIPARAGFILETIEVGLPEGPGGLQHGPPPWAELPTWAREMVEDKLQLSLQEKYKGEEAFPIVISGMTDEDPIMHITKEVANESGVIWTSYVLTMDGGGTFIEDGTTSSSHFQSYTLTPTVLTFTQPDPVLPGEVLRLDFDVLVPTTGFFAFTITQAPVPEPATLAFLGLGATAVLVVRRRRAR